MDLTHILEHHFGISNPKLQQLGGYDTINTKVTTGQKNYILKQYQDSNEKEVFLRTEDEILQLLNSKLDYDFPYNILQSKEESLFHKDGSLFRLLSFLEGSFLAEVEHTLELNKSFGAFLASMNKALWGVNNPVIAAKINHWDLQHFLLNNQYISAIPTPKNRTLVSYFYQQFQQEVLPYLYQLRKSIIHGDANDWNIITQNGKVTGAIDFEDTCYSPIINELAIALAYHLFDKKEPLNVAAQVIEAYHEIFPLEELELDLLYYLIAARLCTSVCNSAYKRQQENDSAHTSVSEKQAWVLLEKWITINPIRAKNTFRVAAKFPPLPTSTISRTQKKRDQYFSKALSLSYTRPIKMSRSALQYMYDQNGNTFLDAYNNIMITGHCHPKVVAAGQKAMARLNTNTRYLYDELHSYAEKLLQKFPPVLSKVFFVNSGSAASDLAIRLAIAHTHQEKIMVVEHGYHGNTQLGIDISHYKYAHKGGTGKSVMVIESPLPDTFNGPFKENNGRAGKQYAQLTQEKIEHHNKQIAAFIAEPIVGCGGQIPLAKGYLQEIYPAIRAQGGVCISDEVQVGFGRLGNVYWGFEQQNVVPDIVILGKPMANGHPMGAVVTTEEIAASFENGMEFFSSFGGNPVSCAIGEAVLDVIEEEGLQQQALSTGNYLIEELKKLQIQYPRIADVRGSGLFLGVELATKDGKPETQLAEYLKNELRNRSILVSTDGPNDNVIKIKPPLCFTKDNADTLIAKLSSILSSVNQG